MKSSLFLRFTTAVVLGLTAFSHVVSAAPIAVIGYNVEGGYKPDATEPTVAHYIKQAPKADVYMLSELTVSWATPLAKTMGDFAFVTSKNAVDTTDALGIFYNQKRFNLVEHSELAFGVHKYERPALIVTLKEKATGKIFKVIGNHLMRGQADLRQKQAKLLGEWAKQQTGTVIALGDYNFDFNLPEEKGNKAFNIFMNSGEWHWVKPKTLIKSNCDVHYNSILDFVFIHGSYQSASSSILFPESEYCIDDDKRPDHRPVFAEIDL